MESLKGKLVSESDCLHYIGYVCPDKLDQLKAAFLGAESGSDQEPDGTDLAALSTLAQSDNDSDGVLALLSDSVLTEGYVR